MYTSLALIELFLSLKIGLFVLITFVILSLYYVKSFCSMETFLKIITLGLYGLFSKKRSLNQKTEKVKYREDGTIKKQINRETCYDEDEAPKIE